MIAGKGDRNCFRAGLSREHLRRCNGAFVVTAMRRAVDSDDVERMLKDCFESFSELDAINIALVCTSSDVSLLVGPLYLIALTILG